MATPGEGAEGEVDQSATRLFCERWLAAWTGGAPQVEALLEFYAPDARYADPARPGGVEGHDQLRVYFTKLLARYPTWVWSVVEILPTARGFTLKWEARLDARCWRGLDIVELQGGVIVRNEVYFDTRAAFG